MIGLDTIRNANEEMMKYDVMELKPSKTLDKLVSEGRLGRKTGCGFFEYTNKAKESQKN
jgi:3-hydroxyacyl-CoA dehydrogenase